jgi:UDP-2,3-diacylglucosamine pyrophosphatase LpxH
MTGLHRMERDNYKCRAFVVISDTHLGLRANRQFVFENTVTSRPEHVDQFLKWLVSIEDDGGKHVTVGTSVGEVREKKLLVPDRLILNGDILELWDASDRAIEFSSHSLFDSLSSLGCRKIYTVGNHDLAMEELAERTLREGLVRSGTYPWGRTPIHIFSDTYPNIEKGGRLETLSVGNDHYLFLHGHQFSESFRLIPWQIPSFLRDGSEAFRLYSWVILGAWSVSIILFPFLQMMAAPAILYAVIGILSILAAPRIFVSIARPIWNALRGLRYKRKRTWDGFVDWWKGFLSEHEPENKGEGLIHIVYGHTHLIDIRKKSEIEDDLKSKVQGPDFVLINHPSWVKDNKSDYANVFQAAFLYADEEGFEFFGWDWDQKRPFHMPKNVIRIRASGKPVNSEVAAWLGKLGWPIKLVQELAEPIKSLMEGNKTTT